ncbi:ABC-type transport system, involved in lipoprotein release, permease component [Malonomonas rubra DSM 5091]|uniref:ABC-type transport system, involved in lipoprotein release, permease component n=1 Tax=Malonomonas rubra DSM 5091 TaxID=1122189 RepID=A0A1M6DW87_MALRU|nr:FtsX-like permease family protein [Malonomonas rubra]SHI77462.1 ABC-type transport system, involved in lipoprotein release, permease component [Malonomonas rubra DSM 5091]
MDLFLLAWKNLWRSRRRTLITLAALSFSLMLVQGFHNLSFGVYSEMIDSGVRAGTGHLVVYQQDYVAGRDEKFSFDPQKLVSQISDLDGVEAVLPRLYLPGLAQSSRESRGILLTGVDPSAEHMINPFLKNLTAEQLPTLSGREAVLGSRLLKELQLKPGNKFVVTLQRRDGELVSEMFRVHSVVTTGIKNVDKSLLLVGRERAAAMAGMPGEVHELAVVLQDQRADRQVFPLLQALLHDRPQLRALSWDEAMPNLSNAIKLDYASQKFIFVIMLLIVTIGVINTLLMSVMERFREFGVMLAVGASTLRLRVLVFVEAFLLGVVAMLLGSIFGSLLTWYLSAVGIDLRDFIDSSLEFGGVVFDPIMRASWDLPYMLQIAGFMLLLSLAAAVYPAIKAGRILPAEALRHH